MITTRVVKALLLLSAIFVFLPTSTQAKALPKYLFEQALQESKSGDFIRAEKDWSTYINENPYDAAALATGVIFVSLLAILKELLEIKLRLLKFLLKI